MFKEKLETLGLEVVLWDERLTTVAAEKILISADVSRKNVRRSLIRWRLYKFCRAILTVRTRGLKEPLYRRKKRCWIQAVCM